MIPFVDLKAQYRRYQSEIDLRMRKVLEHGQYIMGPEIAELEQVLAACKEAGRRLNAMLSMGLSRPWQDALETLTGSKQMDATAILDYFAPLSAWLDQQLAGKPVGW